MPFTILVSRAGERATCTVTISTATIPTAPMMTFSSVLPILDALFLSIAQSVIGHTGPALAV